MSGRARQPPGAGRASRVQGQETAFAAVTVVAYLLAAVWAKELSLPGTVLIWFPPAGVAVGALYLRPRVLPFILVAELVSTTVVMGVADDFGILPLLVNTAGVVGAYALAAWLMHRLGMRPELRSADDMLRFVLGALVGSAVAAAVGVPVQVWTDLVASDDILRQLAVFWIGDVVAIACITPTVLLVGRPWLGDEGARFRLADDERPGARWHWVLLAEYLAPSAVALALMALGDTPMRFVYLAFVPVVLIAIRHGVTGAAFSTAALGAVMTAGASAMVSDTLDRSDFQLLMLVLTLTGLITGAVVSARRDLFDEKRRISQIVEATPDLVATVRRDGDITYLNPVGRRLLGLGPDEVPEQKVVAFHPDELAMDLTREAIRIAAQDGTWTGENRLRRADGHVFPVSQVIIAHDTTDDGETFSAVCRDMTDQRRLEDQLRRAALYDEATGLPNRALLTEQLARLVDADERTVRTAILFADIDNLQRLNEVFGFEAGDLIVTTMAGRIIDLVRTPDLVARHGGAQFVVVLGAVSDDFDAIRLAHRLLGSFAEPVPIEDRSVSVTGSIGIAVSEPGDDHLDTLRKAEIALHRAREAGGGRVALHDEGLQTRWRRRQDLEADLHQVLTSGTWRLAYQPVIDVTAGHIVSAEALLRWTSNGHGPIGSAFDLVRLAEESGAIVPLGREIFRRACTDALAWHDTGHSPRVSINVSALQLRDGAFVDDVLGTIQQIGIDPACVVIELTETVLADGSHGEVRALTRLRDKGFMVALDDFGTGYSSLSGLRDLPIDIVKLDRTFITDLGTSTAAAAMVEAVVRLADGLSLTVVAEGVERREQLDLLVELGCHQVQGHLFSEAVPPDEVADMLRHEDARESGDGWPAGPPGIGGNGGAARPVP